MCFSPEADAALGLAIGVVGIDALRHVSDRRQIPLAALPILFAAHQLIEVLVWWGLDGTVASWVGRTGAYLYLVIAFLLPVVIPIASLAIESDRRRRRVMGALAALGAVVSVVLLTALVRNGLWAEADGLHVSYSVGVERGRLFTVLYVIAACGAFLVSSQRRIAVVGWLNLLAVTILAWLTVDGVISLWCAWAAVTSVLIAAYLRTTGPAAPSPIGVDVPSAPA